MSSKEIIIRQEGNNAARDVIGQKIELIYQAPAIDALTKLVESLRKEQKDDIKAYAVIEELQRYREPKEPIPIGLQKKLDDGGRQYQVEYAMEAKELFAKKLAENTFFESAQEIHALVLSKIHSEFNIHISKLIADGANIEEVNAVVQMRIIDPLVSDLQKTPFRYYAEVVYGMLYYLTGNCFIRWT